MAISGKNMVVKVATAAAGTYSTVAEIKEASMSQAGNNQDVSTFDSDWIVRMQGLKDATYSLSGFYNSTDTNGQVAIRNSWLNDTPLFVQFLPNGTAGFRQEVRVSSYEVSASADGAQEVSIELEGAGAIVAV
jgi:predicted secreted protein